MSNEQPEDLTPEELTRESEEFLLSIYLSGFRSGIGSILKQSGISDEEGEEISEFWCDTISRDPIAMEMLKQQISELLDGVDSGPKTMAVFRAGSES